MSEDHQTETIAHLRDHIKELQSKLEYRTTLLAQFIPHVQTWAEESGYEGSSANYICYEIVEKFGKLIEQFKEEYAKEIQPSKDGKL